FTYNIVQYLGELGAGVLVYRNDAISIAEIEALAPAHIVISPGPCTPNEAGIFVEVIRQFSGRLPLLRICLGHQSIGQAFGSDVLWPKRVKHGNLSAIHYQGKGVFASLPSTFTATRNHSLVVDASTLPECLEVTACTENESGDLVEIMGLRHRTLAVK